MHIVTQLRTEHQVLDHHQSDIDKHRNFTYTVDEQLIAAKPTEPGQYTTNCVTCNMTCHEHCAFANDDEKINCSAMTDKYCILQSLPSALLLGHAQKSALCVCHPDSDSDQNSR